MQSLVGSKSTQPLPGTRRSTRRARRRRRPGAGGLGRQGAEVAADVAGRQAERAQAGDLQMREILADAAPFFEESFHGSAHFGGFGIEDEILVDAAGEVASGFEKRAAGRETTRARNAARVGTGADARGIEGELISVQTFRGVDCGRWYRAQFPRTGKRRDRAWPTGLTLSSLMGFHHQTVVRFLQIEGRDGVAEVVAECVFWRGGRVIEIGVLSAGL